MLSYVGISYRQELVDHIILNALTTSSFKVIYKLQDRDIKIIANQRVGNNRHELITFTPCMECCGDASC